MLDQKIRILLISLICLLPFGLQPIAGAKEPSSTAPKIGFNFVELPTSIKELRYAFECEDGIELDARWVAQNVGKAAPPNHEIDRIKMKTRGPLNLARLSRPTKGWPVGLYRLELVHKKQIIHRVYFVLENLEAKK